MKKNKLILITLIIVAIGSLSYVTTFCVYLILKIRDVNEMEKRRSVLLYETDHKALLEACRELSQQIATGQLKHGTYFLYGRHTDPETKQFPQLIRDIDPFQVLISVKGEVVITMSARVIYGIIAFPENLDSKIIEEYKAGNQERAIELIDGLWYFDNDFVSHPKHKKEVEELLKKD